MVVGLTGEVVAEVGDGVGGVEGMGVGADGFTAGRTCRCGSDVLVGRGWGRWVETMSVRADGSAPL